MYPLGKWGSAPSVIGGHLSVDSSQLGYCIGIEVRVSLEVRDEILGSLQESIDSV